VGQKRDRTPRRDIFVNDDDRRDFVQRFQALLEKMEVEKQLLHFAQKMPL
jgi:hypothetical protein